MKIAVFSTKSYDEEYLLSANKGRHELVFFKARLTPETMTLAHGFEAICVFVHDVLSKEVIQYLAQSGCKLIALRCAGYNNVDLEAASRWKIPLVRVPAYAPEGVAEFAVGLILALNRKYHKAYARVREANFSLKGLLGFNLSGKTVGVVGTGKIGRAFSKIMLGFGCKVLAYDPYPIEDLVHRGAHYAELSDIFKKADIISLHCPLTEHSRKMINQEALESMKDGVMLLNTSRGELIDTTAIIEGLKSGKIGHLGIDVYESEEGIFFEDLSSSIMQDDKLARLTTFPNVIVTSHQAFFTEEAMHNIAATTLENINEYVLFGTSSNLIQTPSR